eukprot:15899-Chlamydomonas_euryale.AAC.2
MGCAEVLALAMEPSLLAFLTICRNAKSSKPADCSKTRVVQLHFDVHTTYICTDESTFYSNGAEPYSCVNRCVRWGKQKGACATVGN